MDEIIKDPILNIKIVDASELRANDYNPNVVFNQELSLLEYSMLKTGWVQPILVSSDMEIIDGYHRWYLSMNSKKLKKKYGGKVPIAIIAWDEAERMMLTIRINRAKGSHIAVKMSEIVKKLHDEHGLTFEQISEGIGASKKEVMLLYEDNIFKNLDIAKHKYSRAWYPKAS